MLQNLGVSSQISTQSPEGSWQRSPRQRAYLDILGTLPLPLLVATKTRNPLALFVWNEAWEVELAITEVSSGQCSSLHSPWPGGHTLRMLCGNSPSAWIWGSSSQLRHSHDYQTWKLVLPQTLAGIWPQSYHSTTVAEDLTERFWAVSSKVEAFLLESFTIRWGCMPIPCNGDMSGWKKASLSGWHPPVRTRSMEWYRRKVQVGDRKGHH